MNTITTHDTQPDEQLVLPFNPPLKEAPLPEPDELEILRLENAGLKQEIRLRDARDRLTACLRSAGARSSELLFASVKDSVQYGEDGSVINADDLVAGLKERFPEQFGPFILPTIDGGAGTANMPNILSKDALAQMSPAEIARLDWSAVREALSN